MVEQIKFELGETNEIILRHPGKYGAKGEKRAERRKRTPEEIKKQNQRNKGNLVRRKIKLNFSDGDYWCTLTYPKGTRKEISELKKDFQKFIRRLRDRYKKHGYTLKFIYRMEIGKRGGLHIHFLVNRVPDADLYIKESWEGRVWFTTIYEEGGYEQLADYITKPPTKEIEGQMNVFGEEERKNLIKYGCSKNLIHPDTVKTVKKFSHWTLKRFLCEEDPKPSEGFVVEKDSIYRGINPYTGLSYITYTERKLE